MYSENTKVKVTLSAKQRAKDDNSKEPEKVVNNDNNLKTIKNSFLVEIYNDLLPLYVSRMMDSFLLYLFAVVVRDLYRTHGVPSQLVRLGDLTSSRRGEQGGDDSINTSTGSAVAADCSGFSSNDSPPTISGGDKVNTR